MQTAITSKNIFQKPYEGFRFSMKFARLATTLALLFCVCGAMSATDYYVYTSSTASIVTIPFNRNTSWKIKNGTSYADTQSYPTSGDSAYFGAGTADASAPNIRSSTAYNIPIPTGGVNIAGAYIYLSDNTSNTQIYFSSGNEFTIKEKFEIRQATGLSNIDIQLNLVDIARNSSPVNIKIPSGMTITVGNGGTTTINGNIVIESGGKLVVNGTLNATSITNNADGTINIGDNGKLNATSITNNADGTINIGNGTLVSNGAWKNEGTVKVGNGNVTFTASATDEGTWQYTTNRTNGIANIQYKNLEIDQNVSIKLSNNLVATNIVMSAGSVLDLVEHAMYTNSIHSNGAIRLYGTQEIKNVAQSDRPVIQQLPEVEFYGNTGSTKIEVSKMASRVVSGGVTFSTLKCDLSGSGSTDAKVLDFTDVTYIGTLDLKGNTTNKLGITGDPNTSIALANARSGSNLRVNYNNVVLTGNECNLTDGTSVDFAGNAAYDLHNGWRFPDASNVFYWVGGNGNNWSTANNWRYGSTAGSVASKYPGEDADAKVHITTGGTVSLNDTLDNTLKSLEITNSSTLNLGAELSVAETITIGNATTTATFDLASYNVSANGIINDGTIKLHGTQTVTGTVTNGGASTVEFYENTNATQINVSQMGNTFATLKCDTSTSGGSPVTHQKVLYFSNVTDVAMLNLNSNATNPLVIQGNANTQITVANTARGSGNNLHVDYKNVQLTGAGTPYALTNSLGRDTTTGTVESKTTGIRNGWNFGGVAEYYFWTSGDGNWNEVGKWEQADDPDPAKSLRIPAERYPGQTPTPAGFGGYHVYIEPASATPPTNATVTLNVSSLSISKITIDNNGTLELGANNLSVRGTAANSWTNNGTVTVTSGNATFATPATDSGTWTYNNTSSRSLINLTYKDLNLSGTNTNTITPIADVSATGKITIGNNTTFDLANRNLSAATIENNGTVRLHGTQNVISGTGKPTFTGGNSGNVEFYGNTGGSSIDVSKMGTSYGNLTITGNKNVAFPNTTVSGNLILKGANDNAPLTITTNAASATINVATSQQPNEGQYLRIDRAKVTISGSPFGNPACSYYAKNSYDTDETTDAALQSIRSGWKIDMPIQLTNMLLSVAPLGGNTVYVRAEQSTMDGLSSVPSGLIANMLKRFFRIYESTGTSPAAGITVTRANLIRNAGKVAWIQLTLSGLGNITIADLQKYYVRTYTNKDASTGGNTEGFHPISDFAVGAVNPLYAYDNRYADDDANWQANAQNNNVAIRNWDANQGNNGSLLTGKDITMSVRTASGAGNGMGTPIIYLSTSPDSGSQSSKYNGDTGSSWRVWLPNVAGVNALTATANNSFIGNSPATAGITVTGSFTNPTFNFSSSSLPWKDGDQITFMFGVTDAATGNLIEVGSATLAGVTKHPLYALRLRDASDINSLDLWSFRLRGMNESQRGSVSIRNNVLNTNTGEQVSVEVVMPETGMLNVMVMTLDGRIVKYLQHGEATEGKHAYHWDGKDNSGKPVARGMYFVRVVGTGLDETRKVMAVRQ